MMQTIHYPVEHTYQENDGIEDEIEGDTFPSPFKFKRSGGIS